MTRIYWTHSIFGNCWYFSKPGPRRFQKWLNVQICLQNRTPKIISFSPQQLKRWGKNHQVKKVIRRRRFSKWWWENHLAEVCRGNWKTWLYLAYNKTAGSSLKANSKAKRKPPLAPILNCFEWISLLFHTFLKITFLTKFSVFSKFTFLDFIKY